MRWCSVKVILCYEASEIRGHLRVYGCSDSGEREGERERERKLASDAIKAESTCQRRNLSGSQASVVGLQACLYSLSVGEIGIVIYWKIIISINIIMAHRHEACKH